MSVVTQCDCCLRITPDIDPKYSLKKKWRFLEYNDDSQGGWEFECHICESCWKKIGESVRKEKER